MTRVEARLILTTSERFAVGCRWFWTVDMIPTLAWLSTCLLRFDMINTKSDTKLWQSRVERGVAEKPSYYWHAFTIISGPAFSLQVTIIESNVQSTVCQSLKATPRTVSF